MTTETALQWVVAIGLGAIVAELIRSLFQRRKMSADAAKVITDAATSLLGPLQSRVRELEAEIEATRRELTSARLEVSELRRQIANDSAAFYDRRSAPRDL